MSIPAQSRVPFRGLAAKAIALAAILMVGLSGCASFRASATPVVPLKSRLSAVDEWSESTALLAYYSPNASDRKGLDQAGFRNYIADIYMAAADARYDQFKADLSQQVRGSNFGSTATVLVLNGVAIVSGIEGARALAAASAVVTGTNAALNKEVYYDKTLQALLAAMEGNRTTVKIRVHTGLRLPPNQYSLRDALDDIRDLEAQASLDSAIQQLTALATTDTAVKKDTLKSLYIAPLLAEADADKLSAMVGYVTKLSASSAQADHDKLDDLATKLHVEVGGTPRATRNKLVLWLNAPAQTADLDSTADKMKQITGEDPKP